MIITNKNILYINFLKWTVYWKIELGNLMSVSPCGMDVVVNCTRNGKRNRNKRRRQKRRVIICKTKDVQQMFLMKIGHYIQKKDEDKDNTQLKPKITIDKCISEKVIN